MKNERWLPVKGFEGKYEISEFGDIKSLARIIGYRKGFLKAEKIVSKKLDSDGYPICTLCVPGRRHKTFTIHKLVASHFIGEIPKGAQVCHKDGDKLNSHYSNLYIGDHVSNTIDRYKHGRTKLSLEDVRSIRFEYLINDISQKKLGEKYNVQQSYISRILNGTRATVVPNTQSKLFAL